MVNINMPVTTQAAPAVSVSVPACPTFTTFHCPNCGAASHDFKTHIEEAGFLFSMRCPACRFRVESLIHIPQIATQLGLA